MNQHKPLLAPHDGHRAPFQAGIIDSSAALMKREPNMGFAAKFESLFKSFFEKIMSVKYPDYHLDMVHRRLREMGVNESNFFALNQNQVLVIASTSMAQHLVASVSNHRRYGNSQKQNLQHVRERAEFAYLLCLAYNFMHLARKFEPRRWE